MYESENADVFDQIMHEINGDDGTSTALIVERTVHIQSEASLCVSVAHYESGDICIQQDGAAVYLDQEQAEALFLVLDAMLNS